jgi:hypothetical protein
MCSGIHHSSEPMKFITQRHHHTLLQRMLAYACLREWWNPLVHSTRSITCAECTLAHAWTIDMVYDGISQMLDCQELMAPRFEIYPYISWTQALHTPAYRIVLKPQQHFYYTIIFLYSQTLAS